MAQMKKHVGVINNTGARIIIVYREIPTDENNCLILETDRLPDMYHDNIMSMVTSKEAQESNDFADILNRRTFSDGRNALLSLHNNRMLVKVPVSLVTLYPYPGQALPLALLNAQINGTLDKYKESEELATQALHNNNALKANESYNPTDKSSSITKANTLLLEAEMLKREAYDKEQEAFRLAPNLNPANEAADNDKKTKTYGRPKDPDDVREAKALEKKAKRKAKDQENSHNSKAIKEEAALKKAVEEKIIRDANRKP